jgi:hypothetical protein
MTPVIAAASTHTGDSGAILIAALFAAVTYLISCAIWPFRSCRNCGGLGRFRSPSGRAWRNCHACKGTGGKVRLGRRAWTYLTRTHDRAHRSRRDQS